VITAQVPASILSVFVDQTRVGSLYNTHPLAFSYDNSWLLLPGARPIDPQIPLGPDRIATPYVHAFFENLLPEGDQRKLISLRHHVSSIFGLLLEVGGDTAGSFVLLPDGQVPQPPLYKAMTWEQVDRRLHASANNDDVPDEEEDDDDLNRPRISISGAQVKMLLAIDYDGSPLQPMGTTPSTHILKPDMVRPELKIWASAANETIVMRTAQLCGMPTARVSWQPIVRACLVERYDRSMGPDGTLKRLWQADFCQLSGLASDTKYEADGGPTFKGCFDILSRHTVMPAHDQRNLLRWLIFNLAVGNNDSHAKNLSILATPEGLRLAPFYDLMSTRVYNGLGSHFAFSVGGEFNPGKVEKQHLLALAESLAIAPKYLLKIASETIVRVLAAVPLAVAEVLPHLSNSEQIMAERLELKILGIAKKMQNRLVG
jgi:serine/threonine-protein kinase HipA